MGCVGKEVSEMGRYSSVVIKLVRANDSSISSDYPAPVMFLLNHWREAEKLAVDNLHVIHRILSHIQPEGAVITSIRAYLGMYIGHVYLLIYRHDTSAMFADIFFVMWFSDYIVSHFR
jgi:hypothetical protein